jgi:hypothetical protein
LYKPAVTAPTLPWYSRIGRAFEAFFSILGDGGTAARWPPPRLPEAEVQPVPARSDAAPEPVTRLESAQLEDGALLLLSLLQAEGRFVDFVQQEIDGFSDAEVGAVARVIHAGCRKVLGAHLRIEAIRSEPEGQAVSLEPGFNPHEVKLTGKLGGGGQMRGHLRHRGWQAKDVRLPEILDRGGVRVLCPAEVEL